MKKALLLVLSLVLLIGGPIVSAATLLSVQDAMTKANGTDVSVGGYIVGVPVSTSTVQQSGFTSDFALALADDPNETQKADMIFVKLDSQYRSEFGLMSNPSNMGDYIQVNGTRDDYFAHEGIEFVTSITRSAAGEPSPDPGTGSGYYADAEGLTGAALKQALHNIIDDHTEISYANAWDALRNTDEDPANRNNVILLYTGKSISKFENGGLVDQWNREHVWPQSKGDFGTTMGTGTDLHALRPTDVTVNSSRQNLDFDNGGRIHPEAPDTFYDSDSWEPRDEVKGDIARMVFYMAVRYEGDAGEVDLEVLDSVNVAGPYLGKLSTLKQWHEQDPVDAFERNRNETIFSDYQGNRNPFIDNPEYVEAIW
ncbi:endonuclease [Jeotgalibacillus sp. R-1-5s-1]|uniref:endonuclease n=1 Tax=Jeotgalibacillus sp. R-1-5s-1 TaxID=2555897 RepID=UPI001068F1EB|nr:endonuclease [Jeotgalibacillus sp. R-1-5s-1]TFD99908.1 ribonuclease [Jeotgalibacillus sp. R-1-5s-1]